MITTSVNICTVSGYESGQCTNWIYYYNDNGGNGGLLRVDEDGHIVAARQEILSGVAADPLDYPPALYHLSVYWASVYWAAMTMSTIGYGDVTPQTDSERVYVVVGKLPPIAPKCKKCLLLMTFRSALFVCLCLCLSLPPSLPPSMSLSRSLVAFELLTVFLLDVDVIRNVLLAHPSMRTWWVMCVTFSRA